MRRVLPLSAIISGLLAPPVFAGPPVVPAAPPQQTAPAGGPGADASIIQPPLVVPDSQPQAPDWRQPFPGDMPQELRAQLQQLEQGRALDANGMQELQRRLAQDMQAHLQRMMALAPAEVQIQAPGPNAMHIMRPAPTAEMEKAAFLGISTSPVTPSLRQQLKLPRGIGLVVDFVEKDSPAATAGIRLYDILEKLDDQVLINPQQLAVLVRSKKPGDAVNLSIIREGQRLTITAKLTEKEMPVLDTIGDNQFLQISPDLSGIAGLNGLMKVAPGDGQFLQIVPDDQGWQKSVRVTVSTGADGTTTRTLVDDQHDLTLTTDKDGRTMLTAKDRAGNVLYQGPYESPGKNEKIPADVLAKVRTMEKTAGGITTLRAGPAAAPQTMTLTRSDADHEITLRIDSRGRMLTVKDVKSGKTLFDGPANTDADLKTLPQAVIDKVHALARKAVAG